MRKFLLRFRRRKGSILDFRGIPIRCGDVVDVYRAWEPGNYKGAFRWLEGLEGTNLIDMCFPRPLGRRLQHIPYIPVARGVVERDGLYSNRLRFRMYHCMDLNEYNRLAGGFHINSLRDYYFEIRFDK